VSASSGEWHGTKHAGIYSREGFDFGIGGSRSARRQPVAVGRQLVAARRPRAVRYEAQYGRCEARGGRREVVGPRW
jgi:hypothetical protein